MTVVILILSLFATSTHVSLMRARCVIILRQITHIFQDIGTDIIKKGEIYQKPKSSVVWVGET